jgi:type 1 fimbria pilin
MIAGRARKASITMKNTGTTAWTRDTEYTLASQNPANNLNWGVVQVELAHGESIAPGRAKTFTFTIKVPTKPGTYNFQWRMVQECKEEFGEFITNVAITVRSRK